MPGRSGQFAAGMNSGPSETASLQQRAARFNQQDPRTFKPDSVLQPIMHSADGMSTRDYQRMTPTGMLPDFSNGASQSTANQLVPKYGMNLNL